MTLIPIYNEKDEIVDTINFEANLDIHAPRYMNEGGSMGLARTKDNKLVLMYLYEEFPSCDRAEYISEEEAYELCLNRGKRSLLEELHIQPKYNNTNRGGVGI